MRKLILSMFMSLDGYIEGPDGFVQPAWSDEVAREWSGWAGENGGHLLYGRVNFEFNRGFWTSDEARDLPEREFMNSLSKSVASRTLTGDLGWNGRAVADVAAEVARLKAEDGKAILSFGGAALAHSLIAQDLADEYRVMVGPVLLGGGKRLFPEGVHRDLRLVESRRLDVGSLILRYERA
ncbi:dihydrofolate reductase family protein [uncultured Phenylobacterium sp.]|uniref:dihydrofolate reductase family protein n=1 Tax=uncultured Phenylobacterium sp. TaxID=349273 RepID=UPI0025CFB0DA|nr:dihydrofolate reductase family protein [uncultured Phenylobacterium sp.]